MRKVQSEDLFETTGSGSRVKQLPAKSHYKPVLGMGKLVSLR